MADGHEHDDGVAACGRGRGIHARRHVHVEAGLVGDQVLFEDGVEAFFEFFGKEDVVCAEFGELTVECPVEGDAGARGFALEQGFGIGGAGQEVVVGICQVGVADDYVC